MPPGAFLYPADPLRPRAVDEAFRAEAQRMRAEGAEVGRLDHDALVAGEADRSLSKVPCDGAALWYRGWMVPVPRYRELEAALEARGARLAVGADAYARAHELPGWYAHFAGLTPASVWCAAAPGHAPEASMLARAVTPLGKGPGFVKDFVKSRKHEWREACFVPDLADTAALHAVAARMVELQGDFLAGGVVVRAFEDFSGPEARAWWVRGRPVSVGAHPDTPDEAPHPPEAFVEEVARRVDALGHPFIVTDLACTADGRWRVVEVGDGQVTGLPEGTAPEEVLGRLA
ncbi:ATP-grasp domain-containing protein [Nocardiopsis suaedae]|uniref:ATP-grasp domain-containing protein n=1 Tax=Nocardiopsis suaedae TaxID=3018444 RepID=A0ABT4TTP9_9ACTN|nr:ATP-grasp domain-containing protein [Nocardiopsis suaedae]MDA2808074.1 ATP-grasp domain-containing protein [Nocardiopsis suaedae]